MYRGKDIGGREKLIQTCLSILIEGQAKKLYEVLPHISVVRSPLFLEPLLKLLQSGNRNQNEFAAVALGSLGDARAIEPLYEVLVKPSTFRGKGSQSLQASIIHALGDIGDERAIEPLQAIYKGEGAAALRRKGWILSALGNLAQQGHVVAVKELTRVMKEKDTTLRAQAVRELAVAYWHRPNEVPETVFHAMTVLAGDDSDEVRGAALSALSDLGQLGCQAAKQYI
jgi:HEAT repeat protein